MEVERVECRASVGGREERDVGRVWTLSGRMDVEAASSTARWSGTHRTRRGEYLVFRPSSSWSKISKRERRINERHGRRKDYPVRRGKGII